MDPQAVEPAIRLCLNALHTKIKEAERIANAACACAEAGSEAEAVRISMDLDPLLYDAEKLQDAACVLGRLLRDSN